ncbi:MAG: hypothetical protein CV087_21650 [Candidatus Brocadia sp. WS118]|nr:MAG: hypothetical protein CV087_21650 [Candidatus Brocadia sp. WS118]
MFSRIFTILLIVLLAVSFSTLAKDYNLQRMQKVTPVEDQLWEERMQTLNNYPPANPVENLTAVEIGRTWYDYATNAEMGRMLAHAYRSGSDGIHAVFMKRAGSASATRYVTYDYYDVGLGFFFGNVSVVENRETGWGRVINGKNDEALIGIHAGIEFWTDAAEAGYAFSTLLTSFATESVFPGIARHGNTMVFIGQLANANWNGGSVLKYSNNYGVTWMDGTNIALAGVTDYGNGERWPDFNPNNPAELAYMIAPASGTGLPPNGSTWLCRTTNWGTSWNLTLIWDDDAVAQTPFGNTQYIIENFSQQNGFYTSDGVYHVVFGAVQGIRDTTTSTSIDYWPILHWDSNTRHFSEVTTPEYSAPNDPAVQAAMANNRPGNGLGNAYPILAEGPNSELVCIWQQWEKNALGGIVLLDATTGNGTGTWPVFATNIWAAVSMDGGQTWEHHQKIVGVANHSDVYPNITEDVFRDGDNLILDIAYMYDTNPGVSFTNFINYTDASETIWYYERVAIYVPPPPTPPLLSYPLNNASGIPAELTLRWESASLNIDYYRYQVALDEMFSEIDHDNTVVDTVATLTDLEYNTSYYWRVKSYNVVDSSDWSEVWNFTTIGAPLVTPIPFSPVNNATEVPVDPNLNWNPSTGAIFYQLQVSTDQNFNVVMFDSSEINTTSIQLAGLANNTTYYWRVRVLNQSDSSAWSNPFKFTTISSLTLNNSVSFPNRANPKDYTGTDYKIIGLPGNSNISVSSILSGEQGKDWEVYWDNGNEGSPGEYLEKFNGSAIFQFKPGRAFWVIHKGNLNINQTVPALPMEDSGFVKIDVDHTGWNLFSNPFPVPVSWADIINLNQIPILHPLYEYDGKGNFSLADTLWPYVGYYFDNDVNMDSLKIPYPHGYSASSSLFDPVIWRVSVQLNSGEFTDRSASFGVAMDAQIGQDHLVFRKPRSIFKAPQVYFLRTKNGSKSKKFAIDIRTEFSALEMWEMDVITEPGISSQLLFSGIDQVPSHFDVYLIAETGFQFIDLRRNPVYEFVPVTNTSTFKIAVGNLEAIRANYEAMLPEQFELGQNYPNPFNPTTTIPITIPEKSNVTLKVYSILGQFVKTIYFGELERGRYRFEWDGRDNSGIKASSGIYFYVLQTHQNITISRKMILIK